MNYVLYEVRGAVAYLCLNRPEKLNAVNGDMLDAIDAALEQAETDERVRALILSGEGRAFSAGFDLESDGPADGETDQEFLRKTLTRDFDSIMRFWRFPKPVIAAVHGYCLGSAMEISAVCDITIAADNCRFGAPEVRFGSGIVCMILPWVIGQKHARELLLVGSDRIDAFRAESIGLVNRVVPESALRECAQEFAEQIVLNDPVAVQLTKRAMNKSLEFAGLLDALESALQADIEIELTETPESAAFDRILKADGAKAALAWRARQHLSSDDQ